MGHSVEWGKRGARINAIALGIIVTPLVLDESNGPMTSLGRRPVADSVLYDLISIRWRPHDRNGEGPT